MTKNESVIEEVTRKMKFLTHPPLPIKGTKKPIVFTAADAEQIMLLSAAEESYSMAATVLQPALKDLLTGAVSDAEVAPRLETGLHLLEEAMGAHNRYMDSLK